MSLCYPESLQGGIASGLVTQTNVNNLNFKRNSFTFLTFCSKLFPLPGCIDMAAKGVKGCQYDAGASNGSGLSHKLTKWGDFAATRDPNHQTSEKQFDVHS